MRPEADSVRNVIFGLGAVSADLGTSHEQAHFPVCHEAAVASAEARKSVFGSEAGLPSSPAPLPLLTLCGPQASRRTCSLANKRQVTSGGMIKRPSRLTEQCC